ncbi:hypothetical protein YUYDRAFT_05039 [Streptomyces sp. ScaeMP-e48]|uniref:effector-associated constant component EACC1 n=1 Tax=Streptomyces sp. ScaeMP-e48 TaxID=1100823 RepID=UPI000823B67B|nr:hypothetical protein [Streptomyces sp. ScaeMP-e48]SCK40882.1 hypothetical protein YUYDRAFT_05039 [Streptomyces sp. ScaeMP-e48]
MAELRLSVEGSAQDSEELWDWLRREPSLRGRISRVDSEVQDSTMGTLMEVAVEASVAGGVSAVAGYVGQSLSVWFSQRRNRSAVTVTLDGRRQVTVEGLAGDDAERILRSLVQEGTQEGTQE